MHTRDDFKNRLKILMENYPISQNKLQEEIGIQRQTIAKYLSGESVPDAEVLARFSRFFNVSSDYLLGLTDKPTPDPDTRAAAELTGLSSDTIEQIKQISPVMRSALSALIADEKALFILAKYFALPSWNDKEDHSFKYQFKDDTDTTEEDKIRILQNVHIKGYLQSDYFPDLNNIAKLMMIIEADAQEDLIIALKRVRKDWRSDNGNYNNEKE